MEVFPMDNIKCEKCGNVLPADSFYCNKCGFKVKTDREDKEAKQINLMRIILFKTI